MPPKRRQRGEGSVYQRKSDGLWVGTLDVGYRGGKRWRIPVYASTQRGVIAKLNKAKRELEVTGGIASRNVTVEAWMNHWLDTIADRRNRPSTLAGYRSKTEQYIIPELGKRRLDKLEPQHIRGLDATMKARGLADATRLQTYAILKRALTVAVREGKVTRNVAGLTDPPSLKRAETEVLTLDEIHAVLAVAAGTPLESRWLAALMTGLRQGEALGLAWKNVDLEEGMIKVERSLQRVKGEGLQFVEPKSERSKRIVPMTVSLSASLAARYDALQPDPDDLVWAQYDGTPFDPARDWQSWSDLLAAAGVRHVRLHDARHAAATYLGSKGIPDVVVSGILGHAQVRQTHGYMHATPEMMRAATAMIEAAFTPKAIES